MLFRVLCSKANTELNPTSPHSHSNIALPRDETILARPQIRPASLHSKQVRLIVDGFEIREVPLYKEHEFFNRINVLQINLAEFKAPQLYHFEGISMSGGTA